MRSPQSLLLFYLLPVSAAAETVLGAYIFSRHGDRISKSTPPTVLTPLGYSEIFSSGSYYRHRYISRNASSPIAGIAPDLVNLAQISARAPLDNVLMSSAQGFLQGLYPPVGTTLGAEFLRNNRSVEAPLDGYQLIPIQTVTAGTGSEDSAWLQGAGNCANAITSSNAYFLSSEYQSLLSSTQEFYDNLAPVVNATFSADELSYKNAYTIYDLIHVAEIHNKTIPSEGILTNDTLFQLQTLADQHEFNLAYSSLEPIRAIAGSTLASQILTALNTTLTAPKHSPRLNLQLGAYASLFSFFGLANLTSLGPSINDPNPLNPFDSQADTSNFNGIPDYASTMVFELVTNATATSISYPSPDDVSVRFLFKNGTASNTNAPVAYPLFGQSDTLLSWNDFSAGMSKFAIGSQIAWCQACGNSTGVCASNAGTAPSPSRSGSANSGGISKPVAGVIGAIVALAVVLGVESLILLIGGLRIARKKKLAATGQAATSDKSI